MIHPQIGPPRGMSFGQTGGPKYRGRDHRPEEIVAEKLRQVDVLTSQGRSVTEPGDRRHRRHGGDMIGLALKSMAG